VTTAFAPRSASSISLSTSSCGRTMGRMPFLKQLLKKMSAKDGAITQRMPKSSSAQGACSRDDPQPKFSPATRICAFAIGGLVQDEIGDLVAVVVIAHLVEQVLAEARALDRLQELLGDDHVGIDIDQGQGRGNAGELGELVHGGSPVRRGCDTAPSAGGQAGHVGFTVVSGRGTSKVRLAQSVRHSASVSPDGSTGSSVTAFTRYSIPGATEMTTMPLPSVS
jgi:hypothetical protein